MISGEKECKWAGRTTRRWRKVTAFTSSMWRLRILHGLSATWPFASVTSAVTRATAASYASLIQFVIAGHRKLNFYKQHKFTQGCQQGRQCSGQDKQCNRFLVSDQFFRLNFSLLYPIKSILHYFKFTGRQHPEMHSTVGERYLRIAWLHACSLLPY